MIYKTVELIFQMLTVPSSLHEANIPDRVGFQSNPFVSKVRTEATTSNEGPSSGAEEFRVGRSEKIRMTSSPPAEATKPVNLHLKVKTHSRIVWAVELLLLCVKITQQEAHQLMRPGETPHHST